MQSAPLHKCVMEVKCLFNEAIAEHQISMTFFTALLHPVKLLRFGIDLISGVLFLFKTDAPLAVVLTYISDNILKRESISRFRTAQSDFKASLSSYSFSSDWFTGHIPFWLLTFDEYKFHTKPDINALEIGSWEGCSSLFLLKTLPNVKLTCVDLWQGSQQLRDFGAHGTGESNFDLNLSDYKDRLTKFKGTSFSYFSAHADLNKFDLIYVDGSHYFDDVVIDAIKSFEQLKVGGIMIFDDYFWHYYPRAIDNPAAAINVFLRLKKGSYRIVRVYWQIIIEKTADRY